MLEFKAFIDIIYFLLDLLLIHFFFEHLYIGLPVNIGAAYMWFEYQFWMSPLSPPSSVCECVCVCWGGYGGPHTDGRILKTDVLRTCRSLIYGVNQTAIKLICYWTSSICSIQYKNQYRHIKSVHILSLGV